MSACTPIAARAVLVLALLVCALATRADARTDNSCLTCHSNPEFFVQAPLLSEYYRDWTDSPHSAAGLGCDDCHGGNPEASSQAEAHEGILPLSDPESPLYYRNQPDTCGRCHADKRTQFRRSKHFRALQGETIAPTCTTCHRAMSRRPYYRTIVRERCQACHNEQNADHLPLVADLAEEVLHRLNIANGYLGWTRLHFDTLGWPDHTRQRVTELQARYERSLSEVHSFDLASSAEESVELLADLKTLFQEARESPREGSETEAQRPD